MDLMFQVPMQYYSLWHQILHSSPDIATIEHRFCFVPATSFFLELLVIVFCYSPVAYWTPSYPGGSSFGVISFCIFIQFMGLRSILTADSRCHAAETNTLQSNYPPTKNKLKKIKTHAHTKNRYINHQRWFERI